MCTLLEVAFVVAIIILFWFIGHRAVCLLDTWEEAVLVAALHILLRVANTVAEVDNEAF